MREEFVRGGLGPRGCRGGAGAAEEAPVGVEPRGSRGAAEGSRVVAAALREERPVEERAGCRIGVGGGEQRDEPFAEGAIEQVGTRGIVPGLGPGGQVQGPVGAEPGKGRGIIALREDGTVGVRGAADARDEKREDVAEGTVAAAEGGKQGAVEEGSSVGEREDGLRSALREDAAVE